MFRVAVCFLSLVLLSSCHSDEDAALAAKALRVFGTLPDTRLETDNPALVDLGRHLYLSSELSATRTQSCNSCHPIGKSGVDGLRTSPGARGMRGRRNTPTVFNASAHVTQFWDGRAATLEEQAAGPVTNPIEMAMPDAAAVAERLRTSPAIDRRLFAAAFPGDRNPLTLSHAARAIAAFERTLTTSDRFDDFQRGDSRALSAEEKEGLRRFMALGCTSCHNGPLLGARIHQRIGIVNAWPDTADLGRYEVTRQLADQHVFKVPALRNVERTAPYFHDGSVQQLEKAVERMAWHQLGMALETKDRDAIVLFLRSLTDTTRRADATPSSEDNPRMALQ
jgi:cytochrome c peroxidase